MPQSNIQTLSAGQLSNAAAGRVNREGASAIPFVPGDDLHLTAALDGMRLVVGIVQVERLLLFAASVAASGVIHAQDVEA